MGVCAIPDYEKAVRDESRGRALAFCGLPETVAGLECQQLTPAHIDWLTAMGNPFIVGGKKSVAALVQFLWVVNPCFTTNKKDAETFAETALNLDESAFTDLDEYLASAYMDAPQGSPGISYYSSTASLVRAMSAEPYRWEMEETRHTPLRVLHQLIRAEAKYQGATLVNALSDKASGDWLAQVQEKINAGEVLPEDLEKLNG